MIQIIFFIFLLGNTVESAKCYYYPNYPSQNLALIKECQYGCRSSASTADTACLDHEPQNLWWIVFPILGVLLILVCCVGFCYKLISKKSAKSQKNKCFKFQLPFRKRQIISQAQYVQNPVLEHDKTSKENIKPISSQELELNEEKNTKMPQVIPATKNILPELSDSIYIMPKFDFPMPVLPESPHN
ncbi:unnamed protein product [Brachionus calyciflorus]|uniref:Uncharacterized protein n=1 Tax=Brachionus calyciflorus TaxID=104777 RepID=A0A813X892_9BILA|nr:unnamed protein product [Brachionus calyciflorus]